MTKFYTRVRDQQTAWRRRSPVNQTSGWQNRRQCPHILPAENWTDNLYPPIVKELTEYLHREEIHAHTGKHNLCSSWTLCANLYFPFRGDAGRDLLAGFLAHHINPQITSVRAIELEYEHKEPKLKPAVLLGEDQGQRGSGQTSPDMGFKVIAEGAPGLVLVECKYTERWFYECSGHKAPTPDSRSAHYRVARVAWPDLLDLRAPFASFTHQSWVKWVRTRGGSEWAGWLEYVRDRYEM